MSNQQHIGRLISQLEAAGKRSTPQRHAVCQALVEHGGHPTVAEVFDRVRAIFPMISQATVYNTVDTLRDLGLIQPLDISNSEHIHYDLDPSAHINLVCTGCGAIVDLHIDLLDDLFTQVAQRTGYRLDRRNALLVYGACANCQGRGGQPA
jgi:Fe2+ or Zn2+ uptake regulation protein